METIKTTRVAPGFYTATVRGVTYEICNVGGTEPGYSGWTWSVAGEAADDVFSSKREVLEALTSWITNLPVVETKGAMMLRIKRIADAANAGRTVGR